MQDQQRFSNVTKSYLCCFYGILEEMIENMTGAALTDSLSHNFIVQMIPHHRAAIEMSQICCEYRSVPFRTCQIIEEQTKSIGNMQNILQCCSKAQNSQQDICLYQNAFQQITQTMFSQMENACAANNINADFMREMIPHHQGAIQMSQNVLRFDICPESGSLFCRLS